MPGISTRLSALIEAGADPNSVDRHRMGPLLTFHSEVTRYLLEQGADPDLQRNENIAPVLLGVSSNIDCLRLMLAAGANVQPCQRAQRRNGATRRRGEHERRSGSTIAGLWRGSQRADQARHEDLRTLAGRASARGKLPCTVRRPGAARRSFSYCSTRGADPTLRDANKDTPLSWAS